MSFIWQWLAAWFNISTKPSSLHAKLSNLQNPIDDESLAIICSETKLVRAFQENLKNQDSLKVKFVCVPLQSVHARNFGKFATRVTKTTIYGGLHTGLVINDNSLDWFNNGLCVPRAPTSERATFAVDICEIPIANVTVIDQVLQTLAKVIVMWNTQVEYNAAHNNCQHFTQACCEAILPIIGKRDLFTKPVKTHIDFIIDEKKEDIVFNVSSMLATKINDKKKIKVTPGIKVFKTHQELDTFITNVYLVNINKEFTDELQVLRGLDRAFWLRYLADETNADNTPLNEKSCPENPAYSVCSKLR
jgi:hypothetical protein